MWHLENPENPGGRIGGYFFTKEAAEGRIKRVIAGLKTTAESRRTNTKDLKLIAVKSK